MVSGQSTINKTFAENLEIPARSVQYIRFPLTFSFDETAEWIHRNGYADDQPEWKRTKTSWIWYITPNIFSSDKESENRVGGIRVYYQKYQPEV